MDQRHHGLQLIAEIEDAGVRLIGYSILELQAQIDPFQQQHRCIGRTPTNMVGTNGTEQVKLVHDGTEADRNQLEFY